MLVNTTCGIVANTQVPSSRNGETRVTGPYRPPKMLGCMKGAVWFDGGEMFLFTMQVSSIWREFKDDPNLFRVQVYLK